MSDALAHAVRRHVALHADATGVALTPIAGLTAIRSATTSALVHAIASPLVCLVLQGRKTVAVGTRSFTYGAGDSLLITADVPTVSRITRASAAVPYLALVVDLDAAVIADLASLMGPARDGDATPLHAQPTEAVVADAALRLMRLIEHPEAVPVLHAQHVRELHYWLLAGRHGAAIRALAGPHGHARRIARAVALLRADFAKPLPVERLALAAGMSASAFHQHFKTITTLTPVQFRKQLRLIEARRLMTAEHRTASGAAFAVGYESVSQFTREYGRMFGLPPVKDRLAREAMVRAPSRPRASRTRASVEGR